MALSVMSLRENLAAPNAVHEYNEDSDLETDGEEKNYY